MKGQNVLPVNEIIRQAENAGGEMMLCTGDEGHLSLIYEMLAELPGADYPETWAALSRSRKISRNEAGEECGDYRARAGELLKKGIEDGWEDGFFLPFARREEGKVHVNFITSTAQNIYEMITVVCLCDPAAGKAGEIIDRSLTHVCYPPRHTLSAHAWLKGDRMDGAGGAGRELVVLQFSGWVTRDGWFKAAVNVRRLPEEKENGKKFREKGCALREDGLSTSLLDIHLTGPVHSMTEEGNPIVVSFGRSAQAGEKIDYSFAQAAKDQFHLPCEGSAGFLDPFIQYRRVLEPGSTSASQLILVREGGGILTYKGTFASHVQKTSSGFSWNFNDAKWKEQAGFQWDVYFGAQMFFTLHYITNLQPEGGTLTVNSTPDEEDDKKKIDKLAIYWGCLGEHVKIRMADGSSRNISEIKIGERVASVRGVLEVADVIRGEELQGMRRLFTERGSGVSATLQHPVLTADGIKQVRELKPGEDCIVMEDGSEELLTKIEVEEICRCPVYNLVLGKAGGGEIPADSGFMFADGMTVGDNSMQRLAALNYQQKRQQKYGLPPEWKKDVESAVHQFEYLKDADILWKQD